MTKARPEDIPEIKKIIAQDAEAIKGKGKDKTDLKYLTYLGSVNLELLNKEDLLNVIQITVHRLDHEREGHQSQIDMMKLMRNIKNNLL